MKKPVKLKRLASQPLVLRYLSAPEVERAALRPALDAEANRVEATMASKGYRLEATVSDVYGLFTRELAQGTLRLVESTVEAPAEAVS